MSPRLTYGNVAATLALFVALGGTSYAALSINGSDVANGSLTGKDVHNNSLTARDVKGLPAKVTYREGIAATTRAGGQPFAISHAVCKQGETLIGGGYGTDGTTPNTPFSTSIYRPDIYGPSPDDTWIAGVTADAPLASGQQLSVTAYALCAS
jgi:hypothetical protein